MGMQVLESCLYGEDLVAARQYYVDILGLEEVSFDANRHLFMKAGESMVIVFKASATLVPDRGVPAHGSTGPGHLAFSVAHESLAEKEAMLAARGIEIIERVEWGNGAKSIYFRDPAGNILEFATRDLWFR